MVYGFLTFFPDVSLDGAGAEVDDVAMDCGFDDEFEFITTIGEVMLKMLMMILLDRGRVVVERNYGGLRKRKQNERLESSVFPAQPLNVPIEAGNHLRPFI